MSSAGSIGPQSARISGIVRSATVRATSDPGPASSGPAGSFSAFSRARGGATTPAASAPPTSATNPAPVEGARRFLQRVVREERTIERALEAALSGHRLSTAEMLVLQARVHGFQRDVDLAAKVTEKSLGTVRRVMDMQV